ncbi:hypothetical protein SAMN05421853_10282 [Roseivivax halotolerans]|uniref:Transcriptional regulator n=1 Tax=Roseivivax halotolerans TaxID=93684 RepID=A0A1I5W214_9RHOB|nr:hypothetical protein [Roseivivax halotolerans]SFQ13804.1 hypothetical protein SAMN05421853_10282 [Roseivivax halotolerans]
MSRVEAARDAWGSALPDWIEALAAECDRTSQNQVATRLGKSGALVSQVLRARYPARLDPIEELVRGILMKATVDCPALGRLPLNECQAWRRKATAFQGSNTLRVQMYRACHRCPIFKNGGTTDAS